MNYSFVRGLSKNGLAFLRNEAGVEVPVHITEVTQCAHEPTEYKCEEVYLWPKENPNIKKTPPLAINVTITKVIFNDPATIVFWSDGTKTVVKTQNGETFDPEKGLAMAMAKRAFGNKGNYYNHISKWVDKYNEDQEALRKLEGLFDRFDKGIKVLGEKLSKTLDEKPMTFREKLAKEHPEKIEPGCMGGCRGCPSTYGYTTRAEDNKICPEITCYACWDRVIPKDSEAK